MGEITRLLDRLRQGDAGAGERLHRLLYAELKRMARRQLARSGPITLDPTALVHEAWLRSRDQATPVNRLQFFAHASVVMRSVVVDHLRARAAAKRGAGADPVTLSTTLADGLAAAPDLQALEAALLALQRADERAHRVVELRWFGGLAAEDIAELLAVSVPTIKRDWRRARAFLFQQLTA